MRKLKQSELSAIFGGMNVEFIHQATYAILKYENEHPSALNEIVKEVQQCIIEAFKNFIMPYKPKFRNL